MNSRSLFTVQTWCFELVLQKRPCSPKRRTEKASTKPPLPKYSASNMRKGVYQATLDLVQSLCDTSSGLVDCFPMEDRLQALREVCNVDGLDFCDEYKLVIMSLMFRRNGAPTFWLKVWNLLVEFDDYTLNFFSCTFILWQSVAELNQQLVAAESDGG